MRYYEVLLADAKYKSGTPLTYSYDGQLEVLSVVTVPAGHPAGTAGAADGRPEAGAERNQSQSQYDGSAARHHRQRQDQGLSGIGSRDAGGR
jgi:hypothetical protein